MFTLDKHQGSLRCVSAPGEGTEFWIEVAGRQQFEQSVSKVSPAVGVNWNGEHLNESSQARNWSFEAGGRRKEAEGRRRSVFTNMR